MSNPAIQHFVEPLSACFKPWPGQDFELFAKQLVDDLKSYPASVLDEAAVGLRKSHRSATWPTIAQCLEEVRAAAFRQYKPPPAPPAPIPSPSKRLDWKKVRMDADGSFPSLGEIHAWELPPGSIIICTPPTVEYPDGTTESWGEIRRRRQARREAA